MLCVFLSVVDNMRLNVSFSAAFVGGDVFIAGLFMGLFMNFIGVLMFIVMLFCVFKLFLIFVLLLFFEFVFASSSFSFVFGGEFVKSFLVASICLMFIFVVFVVIVCCSCVLNNVFLFFL